MYGPLIAGEKSTLRPHRPEADAPEFVRMLSNPEVTRWLARTTPPTLQEELQWLQDRETDPNTVGWSVEVDGYCVGSVGFDQIDWANQWAVVGIFIGHPELWGRGITTEIAQLLAHYAFIKRSWRKVKAGYIAPNVASGRLQASIGLREVGRWHREEWREDADGNGGWVDHVLTELHRDEWLARRLAQADK